MIIYKALNKITGKCYIGQTIKSLQHRMFAHYRQCKEADHHFARALKKYNKEDWDWSIIKEVNSAEELNFEENKYILAHISYIPELGYNSNTGGSSPIPNEEILLKKSKSSKGKTLSDIHKIKIGLGNKGKIRTEDYKKKISKTKTGIKRKPEHIEKARLGNIGITRNGKPVIDTLTNIIYTSGIEAASKTGVSIRTIVRHCHNIQCKKNRRFKHLDIDTGEVPDICNINIGHKP